MLFSGYIFFFIINQIKGIDYFLRFVDPDGCFNYTGRGQEQIFGYASAIYVLEAALKVNPSKMKIYQTALNRIWEYFLSFFKPEGYFPLVLNSHADEERYGWYDYHHLTVYNGFTGVWLGLASLLNPTQSFKKKFNSNWFYNLRFISAMSYFTLL